MKEPQEIHQSTAHRIVKRMKHLSKWAKGQTVSYFRVFDRDIPGVPFMIDCLSNYWLVWVCENNLKNESAHIDAISNTLNSINDRKVIVKYRSKKNIIKQHHFQQDETCQIQEGGLQFHLNLTRYLDTGLFIDHRKTRDYIRSKAKGMRVLNLFAYTGSFSCYALDGGANFVTSVDLNPSYSEWHQRNCELNNFSNKRYAIITADVMAFLKTNKSKYDIIICDPPSFSQSKRKGVQMFQIQDHATPLINACFKALKKSGFILFSTNYRKFNMSKAQGGLSWQVRDLTSAMCSKDFEGKWMSRCWEIHHEALSCGG